MYLNIFTHIFCTEIIPSFGNIFVVVLSELFVRRLPQMISTLTANWNLAFVFPYLLPVQQQKWESSLLSCLANPSLTQLEEFSVDGIRRYHGVGH